MRLILTSDDAATALSVSRSHFDKHIAPTLPVIDVAPPGAKQRMPRWALTDLEQYLLTHRTERSP